MPIAVLAVLLGITSCSGDGLSLPSAGEPAEISAARGDGQKGIVGQPLTDSLVVLVTDPEQRPVDGVEVAFVPPAGAVLLPNDTVVTGSDGHAAVYYTLSTTAGEQTVEARANPAAPSSSLSTTFHVSADPESAAALVVAGGDVQTGETATALVDSLAVKAVDRFANGVPGIEVTWHASGGSVSPGTVVTGADGRAATQRTLGSRPGPYETTARASGLDGSPVSFAATGIAPPSPQLVLVTQPSSNARAGVALARQPALQLQDPVGAPLRQADVPVTVQIASGTGSLGGSTTARSNADGQVSFSDLSIRGSPGDRTLIFAATDFTSAISETVTVETGPPVANRSSASVSTGTVAGSRTAISVRLKDEFGSSIEGAADAIAISVSGANHASSFTVTDRGNGSYSTSYVPTHSGVDQVEIRVSGTALAGSPFTSTVVPGPANPSTSTAVVTSTPTFFIRVDILVTARDVYGNPVGRGGEHVQDELNGSGQFRDALDNGNGTYADAFVTFPISLSVAITMNGVPIAGSPYTPTRQ